MSITLETGSSHQELCRHTVFLRTGGFFVAVFIGRGKVRGSHLRPVPRGQRRRNECQFTRLGGGGDLLELVSWQKRKTQAHAPSSRCLRPSSLARSSTPWILASYWDAEMLSILESKFPPPLGPVADPNQRVTSMIPYPMMLQEVRGKGA